MMGKSNSEIAKIICSSGFAYNQPWFYNHPYALRCELDCDNIKNAKTRVLSIYNILFLNGVDAVLFDYWVEDLYECDKISKSEINNAIKQLKLAAKWINNYPHTIVRGMMNGEIDDDVRYKSRVVCYVKDKKINYKKIINYNICEKNYSPISFVSFENECVLSIYDECGCDIVFANKEKMCQFYSNLKPYFLEYDIEEMERRIR